MITYLKGDATQPIGEGAKLLPHVVNDAGGWGAGYVLALSRRWKQPEAYCRQWAKQGRTIFKLGLNQYVPVENQLVVVNMCAQHHYGEDGKPPVRYWALRSCLRDLAKEAKRVGASIHCPRFGAGLSGGSWEKIEQIINEELPDIPVFVYDL